MTTTENLEFTHYPPHFRLVMGVPYFLIGEPVDT